MKTEVWLIRHGETEWNRLGRVQGLEDIELNKEGLRQARRVGEALSDTYFTVILSSPLKRAFKTAECIQALNESAPPLLTHADLVERDYGSLSGLTYEERARRLEANDEKEVESMAALYNRAVKVLDHIVSSYKGERLAVVSHGGFIKTILVEASMGKLGRESLAVDNCSISKLVHENGAWNILEYNLNAHLKR